MDDWVLYENLKKTNYTLLDLKYSWKEKKKKFIQEKGINFLNEIEHSEDEGLDPKE